MAKTPSTMVPLGSTLPEFKLLDVLSDRFISSQALFPSRGIVVMFICNHCPFVKHVQEELVRMARHYISRGISFVAINSNDVSNYPDDSPERMKETGQHFGYPFPYLFDNTQEIARAFQAACTPDFFVYNYEGQLVYRGQLDDSRPGNGIELSGNSLREALDRLLDGLPPVEDQKPSLGCNIKWKESE